MASDLKFEITFSSNGEPVIKNITGGVDGMKAAAEQAAPSFGALLTKVQGLGSAFGATLGAGAIAGAIRNTISLGDRLSDLSDQTGISVKTLAGLRVTAEQYGSSVEEVAMGTRFMMRSLVDGSDQTGAAAFAFKKLGISVDDVRASMSDPEGFLVKFAQGLAQLPTHAERLAAAQEIAGRAGGKFAPILLEIAQNGLPQVSDATARAYESLGRFKDRLAEITATGIDFTAGLVHKMGQGLGVFDRSVEDIQARLAHTKNFAPFDIGAIKSLETQLAAAQKLADQVAQKSQHAIVNAGPDPKKLADFTAALEKQGVQLQAQKIALEQGSAAGLEFQLRQQAMTELGIKPISPELETAIGSVLKYASALEKAKENQQKMISEAAKWRDASNQAGAFLAQRGGEKGLPFLADIQEQRRALGDLIKFPNFEHDFDALKKNLDVTKSKIFETFGVETFKKAPGLLSDIQTLQGEIDQLKGLKAIKLEADGSQARDEIRRTQEELDKLKDKKIRISAYGQNIPSGASGQSFSFDPGSGARHLVGNYQAGNIMLNAQVQGSPRLPFSEYWERYAPGVLSGFSKKANASMGITLDSGVLNSLMPLIDRIGALQNLTTRASYAWASPGGRSNLHPNITAFTQGSDAELLFLSGILSRVLGSASGAAGAPPQSGGGNAYVTIDLRGSTIGKDFLRDLVKQEVVPILEDTLARTTGKTLVTQVLN